MKIIKATALILAIVFLSTGMIACGGNVVSATVRLSVIKIKPNGDKDLICGVMEGTVKGTESNPPTVLQATREILDENAIQYSIDESVEGGRITAIKGQKERTQNGVVSGWIYKLNQKDATELASKAVVHDGDVIVYYLDSWTNTEAKDDDTDQADTAAATEPVEETAGSEEEE